MTINEIFDTTSYDYILPEELIAQEPAKPRDSSRLMVVNRKGSCISHDIFRNLTEYLHPGDLMVLNNTKVIPARLLGMKKEGTARIEVFLLRPMDNLSQTWQALVKPGKRVKPGSSILLADGTEIQIGESIGEGIRIVRFPQDCNVRSILEQIGQVPLPPYIHRTDIEPCLYQTVFAHEDGSVAAPTASLHFTEQLLEKIREKEILFSWITLHVGLGTFRPVKEADIRQHVIHEEYCEVSAETAEAINRAKKENRRVIAVGTTVVRTLESMNCLNASLQPGKVNTSLFIYPGYEFKVIDSMITNFHLPKSTLLMLVSAFAGKDLMFKAYAEAIAERYRFFSFGDAMIII